MKIECSVKELIELIENKTSVAKTTDTRKNIKFGFLTPEDVEKLVDRSNQENINKT